jgi:hypothetical protein
MTRPRWNILKEVTRKKPNVADQIMFKLVKSPTPHSRRLSSYLNTAVRFQVYPRLDIHVTKGLNHLLKVSFPSFSRSFPNSLARALSASIPRPVASAFLSIPSKILIRYLPPKLEDVSYHNPSALVSRFQESLTLFSSQQLIRELDSGTPASETGLARHIRFFRSFRPKVFEYPAALHIFFRETFLSPLLATAPRRRARNSGDMEDFGSGGQGVRARH